MYRLAFAIAVMSVVATVLAQHHEVAKLLSDDGAPGDRFGYSVAISGTTAVVGAHADDNDNGSGSGSVYLFDTFTGQQIAKLVPNDGDLFDSFGISVAVSGTTAVIGVPNDDEAGTNSGSAYLFDTVSGEQIAKLIRFDGAEDDRFGISVAISGTTVVVGVYKDDDSGVDSGSAYLYEVGTFVPIAKLVPDDGAAEDRFGISVAISGTTVVVGADKDDDIHSNAGAAYLFDTVTGQQIAKLLPSDGWREDRFGNSVAISGTTAIVGASRADTDDGLGAGSAYLFDTVTGEQIAKLLPNDGAEHDRFGISVAISGNTAVVGADYDDDNGIYSGSAYLFDTISGQQIAKLLPADGAASDQFGGAVAISDTRAVVGAWDDDDIGSAYVFDASPPCPSDLTHDGLVDTRDFLFFLNAWTTSDPVADWNGDGTVNSQDFIAYLNDWVAGC